jgi:hypothetical protein
VILVLQVLKVILDALELKDTLVLKVIQGALVLPVLKV